MTKIPNMKNLRTLEFLFESANRKILFTSLMRKILKISNREFRELDIIVYDYLNSEIRRNYLNHKDILSLDLINRKFDRTEKILEDLENMIDKNSDSNKTFLNFPLTKCNYLVTFKFLNFII